MTGSNYKYTYLPGERQYQKTLVFGKISLIKRLNLILMEGQEGAPVPIRTEPVIKKTPQELAAQVESVYETFLEFTKYPDGEVLDNRYKESRGFVERLLESGVSNEQLGEELGKLYKQGKELGIYSPLEGERKDDFLSQAKEYYLGWGYSEAEAESEAKKMLSKQGFLAELRKWRRDYEKDIDKHFQDSIERHPMAEADESEKIQQLRKRVIYLTDPEQARELAVQFPGGNFLYHGTRVEQAIGILESGNLSNAKALYDAEEERVKREGGERKIIRRNSGYEGISWNYNKIGALPGDRYHLVGFLASPQEVLIEGQQLAIPSRPAPYELIQINGNIDSDRYYSLKTQQELLITIGLGESNSVWSNIAQLSFYRENQAKGGDSHFARDSMLQSFVDGISDDTEMSSKLKGLYSLRENGTVEFSPDLLQQTGDEVPVAAVWLQALIDTGRIKNVQGFEDATTVRQVVERINHKNYKTFLGELRREMTYLEDTVKEEDNKVTPLSVPISQMYLVVPNTDLKRYLRVIARSGAQPKGIVVYDHMVVRLEDFASIHRGDKEALTQAIRTAIPPSEGYIDYEQQILGTEITPDKMAGYRRHVIGEKYLTNRKSLQKNEQGGLSIL